MDINERIAAALQHDAPPPRDPLFRVRLLERRERQRFRRRVRHSFAAGVAVVLVSVLTLNAGNMAYAAGGVLLFALAVVSAAVVYLPEFGRLIRRFSI